MNDIQMVPIEYLRHHPDNPRKDLGDLTELADSIRANGIHQNLTIVTADTDRLSKEDQKSGYHLFWVVIGNRRLEAAKIAGLSELPCALSEMDNKAQVATMLEENMHRQDLTVYEQAQGFQMMMDLGYDEDKIAETTGFSKATVKRRLKMAELDPKALKKVCEDEAAGNRQITMGDFDKIAKIDDLKKRNALLTKIGTSDFAWEYGRTYRDQESAKALPEIKKILRAEHINKLPDGKRYSSEYDRHYDWTVKLYEWKPGDKLIPKVKGKDELFYLLDDTEIEFYTKHKRADPVPKTEEEKAEEKRIAEAWENVKKDTELARQLRREFADGLTVTQKNVPRMMYSLMVAVVLKELDYIGISDNIKELLGFEEVKYEERIQTALQKLSCMPMNEWARLIRCFYDGENKSGYYEGYQREMPRWRKNEVLDAYYEYLTSNGYQLSETEQQLKDGTYPYFKKA